MVINSTLLPLFVKLMKKCDEVEIQIEMAVLLGFLVRFATYMGDDIPSSGIVAVVSVGNVSLFLIRCYRLLRVF